MLSRKNDKILTVQVHQETLNPRIFRVPIRWIHQASVLAWMLVLITLVSSVYAVKEYWSERLARPELVSELENEIQELKIALEKGTGSSLPVPVAANSDGKTVDIKASDEKPAQNDPSADAGWASGSGRRAWRGARHVHA